MDANTLLTSQAVADIFQVSVGTVNRWARDAVIPSFPLPGGKGYRFLRADVENLLGAHMAPTSEAAS